MDSFPQVRNTSVCCSDMEAYSYSVLLIQDRPTKLCLTSAFFKHFISLSLKFLKIETALFAKKLPETTFAHLESWKHLLIHFVLLSNYSTNTCSSTEMHPYPPLTLSMWNMRSSSQTFSKHLSNVSTNTCSEENNGVKTGNIFNNRFVLLSECWLSTYS